jgi:ACR3 family arsenite transporter
MGSFERNLTWWVFGCIAVGIALGQLFPAFFQAVGNLKLAEVTLPAWDVQVIWALSPPDATATYLADFSLDPISLPKALFD